MSTYIVGDVQGCFLKLSELLLALDFNPDRDTLGFAGDLVNRGPDSLSVLRIALSFKNTFSVLGNHDLALIARHFGVIKSPQPQLDKILDSHDRKNLIDWLLSQSLMIQNFEHGYCLVHAGIPPQWSLDQAQELAQETERKLRETPEAFCQNMYGDLPAQWSDNLEGWERTRYIINALTRMRFCTSTGELDLKNTSAKSEDLLFKAWYEWREASEEKIIFGHWASLEGKCDKKNYFALDTGCVWGHALTALKTDDWSVHSVSCAL